MLCVCVFAAANKSKITDCGGVDILRHLSGSSNPRIATQVRLLAVPSPEPP